MVIRKMNSLFDLHGRKIFGFITILIIIAFLGFFTPGFSSLLSPFFKSEMDSVGTAFGKPVTIEQMREFANLDALYLAVQFGINNLNHPGIHNMAENRAFESICMVRAAERLGVCVSDKDIAEKIRSSKIFQTENAFDLNKFRQFAKDSLNAAGYDKAELDLAIKQGLVLEKLRGRVMGWVFSTPNEIAEYFLNTNIKYDVQAATFKAEDFLDQVELTGDEVKFFFEMNAADYRMPAEHKAEVVSFAYRDYDNEANEEVSEAMVIEEIMTSDDWSVRRGRLEFCEALFERMSDDLAFSTPDQEAVTIAAVEAFNEKEKEDQKGFPGDELKAGTRETLVGEVRKRLARRDAGKFAHEVYELIEGIADPGAKLDAFRTAARKGHGRETRETPWITAGDDKIEGIGAEPGLIKAISKKYADIPVSDPIAGDDAVFVSYLVKEKAERPAKIDEVEDRIRETLRRRKAVRAAREAARGAALKVAEALKAGTSFKAASELAPFTDVPEFSGGTAPAANGNVVAGLASSTKPGSISAVKDVPDGALFIYESSRLTPGAEDLNQQKSQIASRYEFRKERAVWEAYRQWVLGNAQSRLGKSR